MRKGIFSAIMMAAFMTGCASFPKEDITVETSRDYKANFSGYRTYAWLGSIQMLSDSYGHWKTPQFDVDTQLRSLISEALGKRGKKEVGDDPDMLVAYAAGVDMDAVQLKTNPKTKMGNLVNVPAAGLIVALIDPQTDFVIWSATATGEMKGLDEETAKKRLEYVVTTMFDALPKQ